MASDAIRSDSPLTVTGPLEGIKLSTARRNGPASSGFVYSGEIVGEETVTVPAGTYTSLITITTSSHNATTIWYAPAVGSVQTDSSELTSYTP